MHTPYECKEKLKRDISWFFEKKKFQVLIKAEVFMMNIETNENSKILQIKKIVNEKEKQNNLYTFFTVCKYFFGCLLIPTLIEWKQER